MQSISRCQINGIAFKKDRLFVIDRDDRAEAFTFEVADGVPFVDGVRVHGSTC